VDAFFQRRASPLTGPAVAGFLLFDRAFPCAVLHNLDRARGLMARLVENDPPGLLRPSWQRVERLRGSLLQLDGALVQELGLHVVLTGVVDDTAALCDAIHGDYLDPPVATLLRGARQLRVVAPPAQAQQQTAQRRIAAARRGERWQGGRDASILGGALLIPSREAEKAHR